MAALSKSSTESKGLLGALLALLASYIVIHLLLTYWRLRKFPGPFWARFTNLQRISWVRTMRSHDIHQQVHAKYGDVVRMGPNMISIADPSAIPSLYPMRQGFPKSLFYRAFIPYTKGGSLPAIFTTQDEALHRKLKTPVAPIYSLSNVITFENFIDEVLDVLFRQLDNRFVATQAIFDLGDWLQYFAFEVMGTMTFSERYGFLETGKDVNGVLDAIWNFMLTIAPMTQIPWFDKIWYKSPISAWFQGPAASPILKVVSDHISERERKMEKGVLINGSDSNKKKDFLSHFMEIQASNRDIPPWAVRAWTFSNVIAGSDSTAAVMKTLMYNLLVHPECLHRVHNELLQLERSAGLSRPYPKWKEISNLEYLDACYNEAVRLIPPFCLPLERVVPKGGVTMCGQFFEEGTVVGMNPWVVNRHKPTFGADADVWRPERWLNLDEASRRKLEGSIMTFGAGRRVCMGKALATLEIKKIAAALIINYEISLPNPSTYTITNSYFFKQTGIDVRIRRSENFPPPSG